MRRNIKTARGAALLLLLLVATIAKAQFDPQIGHHMYMQTAYNPAAAGEDYLLKVTGMHRMQFTGISGAPMSTYFTFCSPFKIGKTQHAAGVRFLNDMYGLWSNQSFYVQYAYRQKLGKGVLGIGAELGFLNITFQGDSVNLDQMGDSEYHQTGDPAIPTGKASGMKFDMGFGLYYSTPKWNVGISYSHVLYPSVELNTQSATAGIEMKVMGTMYVHGGYRFRLRNKNYSIIPSALLMTDFRSWDLDLTGMMEYKDRYRWGVGYRIAGSVNILLGMEIVSGFNIGYTYELPTSKLLLESYGSHEIYLSYGLDILRPKRTNRYKSIRYL